MVDDLRQAFRSLFGEHRQVPAGLARAVAGQYIEIPVNSLLDSNGPEISQSDFATLMDGYRAFAQTEEKKPEFFAVLNLLTDPFLDELYRNGGPQALFQLQRLLMKSDERDARHFCDFLTNTTLLRQMLDMTRPVKFETDNHLLPASPEIDRFAHNVINPVLSRKIFNPGRNQGYLVYGIGRPRVLVSLPFREMSGYTYDVYSNSIDVATSLGMRGYFGCFLMLDYLGGLNEDHGGLPAWLVYFSAIASHADAVIFVSEGDAGLTDAQKKEAAFTPDRVPKKVVALDEGELRWAKHDGAEAGMDVLYFIPGVGEVSAREGMAHLAKDAKPIIENHSMSGFPKDRLIVLGDGSLLEIFPDGRQVKRQFGNG